MRRNRYLLKANGFFQSLGVVAILLSISGRAFACVNMAANAINRPFYLEPRFYLFTGIATCLCYGLLSLLIRKKITKIKLGQGQKFIISLIVGMSVIIGLRYYVMTHNSNLCP